MQRANGFYWCKMSWGDWTIEHWQDGYWDDHGCQYGNDYYISFFCEIDERRIERTDQSTKNGGYQEKPHIRIPDDPVKMLEMAIFGTDKERQAVIESLEYLEKHLMRVYEINCLDCYEADRMYLDIARYTVFKYNDEEVPKEADKFINDNYHVYGGAGCYNKRHLLEDLIMEKFNIDRLTASAWITETTT